MSLPLVSVGIITYNHEKYIRQCLDGVMMQKTNFPFEVIIGEDCSTDKTRLIVKEYEAKYPDIIKPIYHEKNVGGARNAYEFCYPKIKGKYIAICEGDDYWTDPLKLQKQVDFLEQHPECIACFHHVNFVDENDTIIKTATPTPKTTFFSCKEVFHIHMPTHSLVFRNCAGAIPKEILEVHCGDAFLRAILATHGKAARLGFVGANYRKHPEGMYSSKTTFEKFYLSLKSRRKMKESKYFNKEQKKEIKREIILRKILYMKLFLKKREIINFLKISIS